MASLQHVWCLSWGDQRLTGLLPLSLHLSLRVYHTVSVHGWLGFRHSMEGQSTWTSYMVTVFPQISISGNLSGRKFKAWKSLSSTVAACNRFREGHRVHLRGGGPPSSLNARNCGLWGWCTCPKLATTFLIYWNFCLLLITEISCYYLISCVTSIISSNYRLY